MPTISQKAMACRKLRLIDDYEPSVRISGNLGIDLEEIISCLRSSSEENAMIICAMYDRLNEPQRKSIDIDYLIAAARCKDPYKIAGLVCEQYCRVKQIETQMIAARESPSIMEESSRRAKLSKGFNHARMILQTSGVAPVPKNQTNYIVGNRIDNSKNINIGVPSHSEVVDDVSTILAKVTSVPQRSNPEEDRGDRAGEENQAARELDR